MMDFTVAQPVVTGESEGSRFTISSDVDPVARTCVTSIELDPPDGRPFAEEHRQWFHSEAELREALAKAGVALDGIVDEYSDRFADAATLRATWVARTAVPGT